MDCPLIVKQTKDTEGLPTIIRNSMLHRMNTWEGMEKDVSPPDYRLVV